MTSESNEPALPDPEEYPEEPVAPAAIHPDAVENVPIDKKYGWQNPPVRLHPNPIPCAHIGTVSASAQLVQHDVGHEWICTCGTVFVVAKTTGGKKTLKRKEDVADG